MPRFITRYGLWIMVVGLVAAVVYGLSRAASIDQGGSSLERFAQGSLAGLDFAFAGEIPEMKPFVGPNGTELTLADFRGRIILVNLWGTWCPPCIEEMPTLAALQSSRGGEDFQVVAISLENDDDLERPKAALERLTGGVLEFYASPSFSASYDLGATTFPTTIIYDADGAEIARLNGKADWQGYDAIAFIDAAIADGA